MGVGATWLFIIPLCFSLCFQANIVNSQNVSCNLNDLQALHGFSNGLDSRVWEWSNASSSDCCSWVGVSCGNSSGRVVGLSLGRKKLKGSLSKSLAGLDHLTFLNLSFNFLQGAVPSELFKLKNLEVLDLSFNRFNGSIPPTTNLASIRLFNISGNSFTGKPPRLIGSAYLMHFIINGNSFSGPVDTGICSTSAQIQVLQLSANFFRGDFPTGFGNCSSLHELYLNKNKLTGNLPDDLFGMQSLRQLHLQENRFSGMLSDGIRNLSHLTHLDISLNAFAGKIPDIFGSLFELKHLSAHSNNFSGQLPASLSKLQDLRLLNLRNNSLDGPINFNCKVAAHLNSLDLGSNRLHGSGLDNLSSCMELKNVNLAKNSLDVRIPESFKYLQNLSYLSLSNTSLQNIQSALEILQQCRNLTTLVLTTNFHGEPMPADRITGFESLKVLVIPNCRLSGSIPRWLTKCSNLQLLDLSWNQLQGSIPDWIGSFGSLFYLDLSNNSLTGEIPKNLTQLRSLISSIISREESSTDFPFFIRGNRTAGFGLQYNQVTSFRPTLDLSSNKLTGPIWPEFGELKKLHVLDLNKNNLSGTIPEELSGMMSLEALDLSSNHLSGKIPTSLTNLSFLSSFSVADNNLSGTIPSGGQFWTFSYASFKGNKGLCGEHFAACPPQTSVQSRKQRRSRIAIMGIALGTGLGTALVVTVIVFLILRYCSERQIDTEGQESDSEKNSIMSGPRLILLFHNKENRDITIEDLLRSTGNFDQANIIGCGGFGLVYRATLPDGQKVAIKRLSGDDRGQMEREFTAEVEALSRAQHDNLVSLQGYCRYGNDRLLIYSYMENGSLDYWLHEKLDGGLALDWNKRLRIAQGAARGLAYLHQSCDPHILHRDIKSSNILLDENFEAHLADFGLARLILSCDTHVTTDLVGTLGYIPPEYCQSSIATFKGDVYSFGVVLSELLTGKRPMDMCKPKGCGDLISWVLQMKKERRETEVFDPFLYDKKHDKQMLQVLDIACLCLNEHPKLRPCIQQVVLWLDNVGLDNHLAT